MASLQDEQIPLDRAICDAMAASVPATWNVIELSLERPSDATAIGDLVHLLSSPEGLPPVIPNESLYDATFALDQLLQKNSGRFRRAVYRVELLADSWNYKVHFEYATGTSQSN